MKREQRRAKRCEGWRLWWQLHGEPVRVRMNSHIIEKNKHLVWYQDMNTVQSAVRASRCRNKAMDFGWLSAMSCWLPGFSLLSSAGRLPDGWTTAAWDAQPPKEKDHDKVSEFTEKFVPAKNWETGTRCVGIGGAWSSGHNTSDVYWHDVVDNYELLWLPVITSDCQWLPVINWLISSNPTNMWWT